MANPCAPLREHEIVNAAAGAVTASLNVNVTFAPTATPATPFTGDVDETEGGISVAHGLNGDAVFRGVGAPTVKSAPLLSVSAQPPSARTTAVAFVVAPAGEPSKKLAPSHP